MVHFLVLLAVQATTALAGLQCKNMQGKDVDWFMVYKLPKGTQDSPKGRTFAYLDATNPQWTISQEPIESPTSAVGYTIGQVYGKPEVLFAMYNDEDPVTEKTTSSRGHIKGVIGFDSKTGFWVQHSAPAYPPAEKYDYPESATKYGQTMICFSVKTADLSAVAEQLRYMVITPYVYNIPDTFKMQYPELEPLIVQKKSLTPKEANAASTSVKVLKTIGGYPFTSFSKHTKFAADLWGDLVAKEEKVPLVVETWLNGAAKDLESICEVDKTVKDISSINLSGNKWTSSKDHAKWGASLDKKRPLVCVGDINRQASQTKRGGGALCITDAKVWNSWNDIVDTVSDC